MTVHDLHDALTLLPGDLITATDRLRSAPKAKVIHWRRWVSLAAVLVLVLGTSLVFAGELMPAMGGVKMESAVAQAPAAAAPMEENGASGDTTAEEAPAAEAPAQDSAAVDEKAAEEEIFIDHSHRFAEGTEDGKSTGAYCGNMEVTIDVAGERHVISGSDAVKVTDILINLDYDPDAVCRCMTDITVDTELLTGIGVNLTEGFARCEKGQAALTEKQAQILQEIIDRLLS